ncbi:unnamed protein product [Parnassius apollo]|uniref:(apollo) hypothetical protein n=1 Tax=Parnassius apollo TaxID=110799 RepID=A0A8S3Y8Y6_PARAO|nr:unnamed protein product [Parnassius apollo]
MAREATKVSRLLLYKADASPPSCAVRMLGDILGLHFEFKEPKLLAMEHKTPEFKKLNPMATIPVLQDGDFIVSESHAIMQYLVGEYGGEMRKTLYPSQPRARALVDQCMYFDAAVMFNSVKAVALPTLLHGKKGPTANDTVNIDECYAVLEAYLERNSYVAADHVTIADLSLSTTTAATQIMHELDSNRFPRSADWLARMSEETSFKKVAVPGLALLKKMLYARWKRN